MLLPAGRKHFCPTSLQTLKGLPSAAKDVPSSRTKPTANFLLRKSLWERPGRPGVTENTFPARGYVTVLFVSRANSSVFGGSSLPLAK